MTGVRSFDVKALDINATVYSRITSNTNPALNKIYAAGYYDLGYAASDYVQHFGDTQPGDGHAGRPADQHDHHADHHDAALRRQ